MDNYFEKLLQMAMKISNKNMAKQMVRKYTVKDIMKLARQEAALNADGRDYDETVSGRQFKTIKDEFIELIGDIPRETIVSQTLKESIFDKIEIPDDLPDWQKKALVKIANADKKGDLQVRSLFNKFADKVSKDGFDFNKTKIDLLVNSPLEVLKHLLGNGLSFGSFITQTQEYGNNIPKRAMGIVEKERLKQKAGKDIEAFMESDKYQKDNKTFRSEMHESTVAYKTGLRMAKTKLEEKA